MFKVRFIVSELNSSTGHCLLKTQLKINWCYKQSQNFNTLNLKYVWVLIKNSRDICISVFSSL